MSERDELARCFKLLRKHERAIIDAYLEQGGELSGTALGFADLDVLVDASLAQQPASNEPVRLAPELRSLFDRVLRNPRRQVVDAEIGAYLDQLRRAVNQYRSARSSGHDAGEYLERVERLAYDLTTSLRDRASWLWHKINSEFGYVTTLRHKLLEIEGALEQATRLVDVLEATSYAEMEGLAGGDLELRRFLCRWVPEAVDQSLKEARDALETLKRLSFKYREKDALRRLIDRFRCRYQAQPGGISAELAGDPPQALWQVDAVLKPLHANQDDPAQQEQLAALVQGLRKARAVAEAMAPPSPVLVQEAPEEIHEAPTPLEEAVESFLLDAALANAPLRVSERVPSAVGDDYGRWLHFVYETCKRLGEEDREVLAFEYVVTPDSEFDGVEHLDDILVWRRAG